MDGDTTLARLHDILQATFGWWNCHLHEFEIDGVRYGTDDGEDWGKPPKNERRFRLRNVVQAGSSFLYVYNFGDYWRHKVTVEKVLPAGPGAESARRASGGVVPVHRRTAAGHGAINHCSRPSATPTTRNMSGCSSGSAAPSTPMLSTRTNFTTGWSSADSPLFELREREDGLCFQHVQVTSGPFRVRETASQHGPGDRDRHVPISRECRR